MQTADNHVLIIWVSITANLKCGLRIKPASVTLATSLSGIMLTSSDYMSFIAKYQKHHPLGSISRCHAIFSVSMAYVVTNWCVLLQWLSIIKYQHTAKYYE